MLDDVNQLGEWMTAWTDWIHGSRAPRRRFRALESTTRRLVAAWVVDGQIENGGIAQARSGVPWMIDEAIAGLRAVGDVTGADALARGDDAAYVARPGRDVLDTALFEAARRLPGPRRR